MFDRQVLEFCPTCLRRWDERPKGPDGKPLFIIDPSTPKGRDFYQLLGLLRQVMEEAEDTAEAQERAKEEVLRRWDEGGEQWQHEAPDAHLEADYEDRIGGTDQD